jgi:proline dehydrogenase
VLRHFFLFLSNRRALRRWMEHSPRAAALTSRFIAGREIEDALRVTRQINQSGLTTTLDYLGESVTTLAEAAASRDVYLRVLEAIHAQGLKANVSIKLTQFGLDVSEAACRENVAAIARRVGEIGSFVRVDMESSAYTARTLALVSDLHETYPHIGTVLQSYLYRTAGDAEDLIQRRLRVRLVKGAYDEPADVAFQKKSDVDANYAKLAQRLLLASDYPALATHDEALLREALRFAEAHGIAKDRFEIQMLYGIRRDLQAQYARQGYRVRVYVPFGGAWYPYFMRRLGERPANVWFLVRHLLRS